VLDVDSGEVDSLSAPFDTVLSDTPLSIECVSVVGTFVVSITTSVGRTTIGIRIFFGSNFVAKGLTVEVDIVVVVVGGFSISVALVTVVELFLAVLLEFE
jgi:hypothetical protein